MAAGAVCLLSALYLAANDRDADRVRDADRLGAAGDYAGALRVARDVSAPPQDARALVVQAYALHALGRRPQASRAFARAVARDPNNWVLHRDWAVVLAQLGRRAQAGDEMSRALALNPRMSLPAGFIAPARSAKRAG